RKRLARCYLAADKKSRRKKRLIQVLSEKRKKIRRMRANWCQYVPWAAGTVKVNTVFLSTRWTLRLPPCARAISLAIKRTSPTPRAFSLRLSRKKASKIDRKSVV